jgi:hypothetical protein
MGIIYPPFEIGLRKAKAAQDPAACQSVDRCEAEARLLHNVIGPEVPQGTADSETAAGAPKRGQSDG